MAIGPPTSQHSITRVTPSITPTLIVTHRIPITQTPRYHSSFQDFLDDVDAEFYNPDPNSRTFISSS